MNAHTAIDARGLSKRFKTGRAYIEVLKAVAAGGKRAPGRAKARPPSETKKSARSEKKKTTQPRR